MGILNNLFKQKITGEDEKGQLFNVKISKTEEISEDAFKELSCGSGDDPGYKEAGNE